METQDLNEMAEPSSVFDGDMKLSQKPLYIALDDILPDVAELTNFALLLKNRSDLVEVEGLNETNEERLKEYHEACEGYGIEGESLFNALLLARLFYLSQQEIEIIQDVKEGGDE